MPLVWRGKQISARVRAASRGAIADTMEAASEQAAAETWRRTGQAAEAVRQHPRPVQDEGSRVVGRWGADPEHPAGWRYLFIEKGVRGRAGGHFLVRAADATYRPGLVQRIRSRMR
jgi:hypothetical protein